MRQLKSGLIFIISFAVLSSCGSPLEPFNPSLVNQVKDAAAPVIEITSPASGSVYSQTVTVSGTVTDDGAVMPVITYEVSDSLNSQTISGSATVASSEAESGVAGTFSFTFSTSVFNSDIIVSISAADWNENESEFIKIPLIYPGSTLSSFDAVPGNNQIALSWEAVPDASSYRLYYVTGGNSFLTSSASTLDISAENFNAENPLILTRAEHGVVNGDLCQVLLKAYDDSGKVWTSSVISTLPLSGYSLVPKINISNDHIKLNWKAARKPENIDVVYQVWRSDTGLDNSFSLLSDELQTSPSFTDDAVVSGRRYYYRVGAEDAGSILSKTVDAEPAALKVDLSSSIGQALKNEEIIDIETNGDYCYALVYRSAPSPNEFDLVCLNVNNPDSPVEIDRVTYIMSGDSVSPSDLALLNGRAYVASGDNSAGYKVLSFSIEAPAALSASPLGNIGVTSVPKALASDYVNKRLYIAEGPRVSRVLVSSPDSPTDFEYLTAAEGLEGITYSGSHIYAFSEKNLYACDTAAWTTISSVLTPHVDTVIPGWTGTGNFFVKSVFADSSQRYLYLTVIDEEWENPPWNYIGGLFIYDIETDPLVPSPVYQGDQGYPFSYAENNGDNLYLSSPIGLARILNIADPASPRERQTFYTQGSPNSVASLPAGFLVADGEAGIAVIQISTPESPVNVYDYEQSDSNESCLIDGILFQSSDSGLKAWQTAPDGTMSLLSQNSAACEDVVIIGDTAFIASGTRVGVLNVSNASGIDSETVTYYDCDDTLLSLDYWGDYLYAVQGVRGVKIFNISGTVITESATIPVFQMAEKVIADNDKLYIADSGAGLLAYDISSPGDPVKIGEFYDEQSRYMKYFTTDEEYVYAYSTGGVYILPIADCLHWTNADSAAVPEELGSAVSKIDDLPAAGGAVQMIAAGDILYSGITGNSTNGKLALTSIKVPENPNTFYASAYDFYDPSGPFVHGLESMELSGGRLWANFGSWMFVTDLLGN